LKKPMPGIGAGKLRIKGKGRLTVLMLSIRGEFFAGLLNTL